MMDTIYALLLENIQYLKPLIYIVGLSLIGLIIHVIVIKRIMKIIKKSKWHWDDVVIESIGNKPILWFVIGGAYFATTDSMLEISQKTLILQILLIVFVISLAMVLTQIAVGMIQTYSDHTKGGLPSTSIFTLLTKLFIYSLAALMVLQTFGISITPILTALGVGGIAVALALQETLANLFAGIHLIASKKNRIGDFIELENGQKGYIEDIAWRNTAIRTQGNNLVILPNTKMVNATVINYSKPAEDISLIIMGGVGYSSDLEFVEKIIIEVGEQILQKVKGGVEDYIPKVRFHEFGDSSINFKVILRVKEFTAQYLVKHEFIKALHARFNKEGIEIPFPQRDVHITKQD